MFVKVTMELPIVAKEEWLSLTPPAYTILG